MGKKAGSAAAAQGEEDGSNDPAVLAKNYSLMCKAYGIKPHEQITEVLNGEEAPDHITVDAELGPVGLRALTDALLGTHEGLGGKYNLITTLRLWRSNAGEEGVRAISDYLLERARDKKDPGPHVSFLQLMDCGVTVQGCKYLCSVLQAGGNPHLLTLNLDHNANLGSTGLRVLTDGLCSNSTLTRLSLAYCEIGPEGGRSVKNLLSGLGTALEQLNLRGNRLGGEGLAAFTRALGRNKSLRSLDISLNEIGPDVNALTQLAEAMRENATLLELKLHENGIEESGAQVLIESGAFDKKTGNATLKEFLVDVKLPGDMFEALLRAGGGAGKKAGKKGKKKK